MGSGDVLRFGGFLCLAMAMCVGQGGQAGGDYRLGPEDELRIWALGIEELSSRQVKVDTQGFVDLPIAGQVQASGLTVAEFRQTVSKLLSRAVRNPQVSVELIEYGSQPVSVLGAVNKPGIYQIRSGRTLAEVISTAGGLRPDAGSMLQISRHLYAGEIPLPGARKDKGGQYMVASINLTHILRGDSPELNIAVRGRDIVSVPRADVVYVMGTVRKPGGFPMQEGETMSVLQALSMAEGCAPANAAGRSRILRRTGDGLNRQELPVDLNRILSGKSPDVPLIAEDILFVPGSPGKRVAVRTAEIAAQVAAGVIIWR
jgi:polysaccharide biosynthesis/export protein